MNPLYNYATMDNDMDYVPHRWSHIGWKYIENKALAKNRYFGHPNRANSGLDTTAKIIAT